MANQDGNSLRDLIRETLKDKDLTITYDEAEFISALGKARPTLVPTGVKCKLDENKVLQTYIRSSSALKHGLQLANSVGIIDSDYYGNESQCEWTIRVPSPQHETVEADPFASSYQNCQQYKTHTAAVHWPSGSAARTPHPNR